jgi:CRP/FNR family transcriptional regulator, anaerobic regulatory protein
LAIVTNGIAQPGTLASEHEVADIAPRRSWVEASTDLSLSTGLRPAELSLLEPLLITRTRLQRGEPVYRCGSAFGALYSIRVGSCKTVMLGGDGLDQVAGYHIVGDIVGIDGIASTVHECQATALEDMQVCRLPFDRIEKIAGLSNQFRRNLHQLLSHECSRVQAHALLLGTMSADQRLAVFLLDLSRRYTARGFSSCEFVLRMTREEIGSYLGLTLETVSRAFSRFQDRGVLQVQGRLVKLLDHFALKQIAG